MNDGAGSTVLVDLVEPCGSGPLWGLASRDLNATLLAWPAGRGVDEHVNDEVDVLLIVLTGDGVATVDERDYALVGGCALLIEKGSTRTIRAGARGIRYVTVHQRRGALQLADAREGR